MAGNGWLLSLSAVSRSYRNGRVRALDDIAVRIGAGEYAAVTGPSGCGKTTLLHVFCGIEDPSAGEVCFDGRAIATRREWTAARATRIGIVCQQFNLLPTLTAVENVEIPMFGVLSPHRARERRALALLDSVGLAARACHRPAELSGGEQQRVAIARSLANRPVLILADEPTGNLDSQSTSDVLALLESCRRREGVTLVVATHDPSVAARADRVIAMKDGRIVADQQRSG
jgi:ABC-type lipoprotein export system ATPase subunit